MEREHGEHHEILARLIPAWDALRSDPRLRRDTINDARRLQSELEMHLEAEERVVIPAIALIPADEARAMVEELRARRTT